MKLSKALKQKNRMAGEISRVRGLIDRENSRLEKDFDEIKIRNLFNQFNQLLLDIVELKSKIQIATAPISAKLLTLAELKGKIEFYKTLDTKSGEKTQSNFRTEKETILTYKAYYTQDDIDNLESELQEQINDLQDEIDDYNASTSI